MNGVDITSIIGSNFPYEVYVCNVYGGQCTLVATINTVVGPPVVITPLPTLFNNIPEVGIKLVSLSDGCVVFKTFLCKSLI